MLAVSGKKNIFNIPSTILDYSLDLVRCGSADIAHLIRVDFISCFLQIASQGNYIFVAFQFSQFLRGECATKIKNYSQFA